MAVKYIENPANKNKKKSFPEKNAHTPTHWMFADFQEFAFSYNWRIEKKKIKQLKRMNERPSKFIAFPGINLLSFFRSHKRTTAFKPKNNKEKKVQFIVCVCRCAIVTQMMKYSILQRLSFYFKWLQPLSWEMVSFFFFF